MIKVYAVKGKEVDVHEFRNFKELRNLAKESDWLWVDFLEPTQEEFKVIADILSCKPDILEEIKSGELFLGYRKCDAFTILSVPVIAAQNGLKTHSLYVSINEKTLLTVRSKNSAIPIEHTLQVLCDYVSEVEGVGPSFILFEIMRAVANMNLEVIIRIRDVVEKIEEKAATEPGKKEITKEVFRIKRQMDVFRRLLWSERQIICNLQEGLIPNIKLSEKSLLSLEDALNSISKEIDFMDSIDNALDGVLRLQDLGMIHKVERTLIYLTIAVIITNIILILLEIGLGRR